MKYSLIATLLLILFSCGDDTSNEAGKLNLSSYEDKLSYSIGADRAKGIVENKRMQGEKLNKVELLKGFKKNFSNVSPPDITESQYGLYGREGKAFNVEFVDAFSFELGCKIGYDVYHELDVYDKVQQIKKEVLFKGFEDALNKKDTLVMKTKDQIAMIKSYRESLEALYENLLLDHYQLSKDDYYKQLPYVLGINNAKMIMRNSELKWNKLNFENLVAGVRKNFSGSAPPDLQSIWINMYGENNDQFNTKYLDEFSSTLGQVMGFEVYSELNNFGKIGQINPEEFFRGLEDGLSEKDNSHLDLKQKKTIYNIYKMSAENLGKYADIKFAGEEFLEENAKKEGIIITESGIQYEILKQGTGPKPKLDNFVTVHYHGTLLDGTVFDSSLDRDPAVFGVTQVIAGWTEILQQMSKGSKYKVYIPEELAYGSQPKGGQIKPYSMLIFEMELLDIK